MTNEPWREVLNELDLWSNRGLRATFWVRDDDAYELSAQLERLYDLAEQYKLNIGLAVIPGKLSSGFADALAHMKERFHPMCHGWIHANYGRRDAPSEFGRERPFSILLSDASQAYKVFSEYFGQINAAFVPPYNHITRGLRNALRGVGFAAVSMGPSFLELKILRINSILPWMPVVKIPVDSSIPRFDTHIDVLDWQRMTARESRAVAADIVGNLRLRRKGFLSPGHPIGLLTHHLVHDEHVWRLCREVFDSICSHKAAKFLNADCLIDENSRKSKAASPIVDIPSVRTH